MVSSRSVILAAALSFVSANALPQRQQYRRQDVPKGFRALNAASADDIISLRFALAPRDLPGLEKSLYAVSTPGSEQYGNYLSRDEVNGYVAPSEGTVAIVSSWLSAHGLTSYPLGVGAGDWISVNATIAQANELLQAEYTVYEKEGEDLKNSVIRTLSYSVPANVKDHILAVHPTTGFPARYANRGHEEPQQPNTEKKISGRQISHEGPSHGPPAPASCFFDNTVDNPYEFPPDEMYRSLSHPCLTDLYDIPYRNMTQPMHENSLWKVTYGGGFVRKIRVGYLEKWRPELDATARRDFDFVSLLGGMNNGLPMGGEDSTSGAVWASSSIAVNTPITVMGVGEPFMERSEVLELEFAAADHLLGLDSPPDIVVFPMTFDLDHHFDPQLALLLCNKYAQLAARGVSLIVPVSTDGVAGAPPWDQGQQCPLFGVSFPASCPYVTSVSTADISRDGTYQQILSDVWYSTSNGGFSTLFTRPAYQDSVVSAYLDSVGDIHPGLFNRDGRAIPDVSLHQQLWNGQTYIDGWGGRLPVTVFGAEHSAGVLGAMVALLNEELVEAGKPKLGFLNPFLYQAQSDSSDTFVDFTTGNSWGCDTEGFEAVEGWDAVSGLGAPIYSKLKVAAGL